MTEDTWTIHGEGFTVTANRRHTRGAAAGEGNFSFLFPDHEAQIRRAAVAQAKLFEEFEQWLDRVVAAEASAR